MLRTTSIKTFFSFALVGALMASAAQGAEFIGGTTVAANHAEGCCRAVSGNNLFDFNGGMGTLLGISESDRQTLDGLDERVGADGIWNPGGGGVEGDGSLLSGANQAVFTVSPPAGFDLITGFQVMNATNAQFDERQSDNILFEVSMDAGSSFTPVLDTPLDVVVTDGGIGAVDFAPAPAQQFDLTTPLVAADVDFIRITATENITSHNNVAPSISEIRIVVDQSPSQVIPEPATFGLVLLGTAGIAVLPRRRKA